MKHVTRYAEDTLCRMFSLPATGEEQDWEVELADDGRVEEFLARYPEIKDDDELAFGLTWLIVASFDFRIWDRMSDIELDFYDIMENCGFDVAKAYTSEELGLWVEVSTILLDRKVFFKEIIEYFSINHIERTAFPSGLLFGNTFHWQLDDQF
ncbi:hypothetical protein [uncultured Roseibium sp.]|uniref:hypothetical protein n=1 Tax=uncultured Roseibium sp. TaxID=1936171 RepID=UPI0032179A0D